MILLLILILKFTAYQQDLEVIRSRCAEEHEYPFAHSLAELHEGEKWGWHSGRIGNATASSTLAPTPSADYKVENLHDMDLRTAWIEGLDDFGIGQTFSFTLFAEEPFNYKNFDGVIEVFNGYCKSESIWKANSRVKTLKMFYNEVPVCLIALTDTWQYQSFNIAKFFMSHQYPDAPFQIREGSTLKFEIVEVYYGEKYKDVAISEFVTPAYGGG